MLNNIAGISLTDCQQPVSSITSIKLLCLASAASIAINDCLLSGISLAANLSSVNSLSICCMLAAGSSVYSAMVSITIILVEYASSFFASVVLPCPFLPNMQYILFCMLVYMLWCVFCDPLYNCTIYSVWQQFGAVFYLIRFFWCAAASHFIALLVFLV